MDANKTIDQARLRAVTLTRGSHQSPKEGLCLMEAVAYVLGLPHSERPPCVSPSLGVYGRDLSDTLGDVERQQLIRFIPRLPGTANDGKEEARAWLAEEWLLHTWMPTVLDTVLDVANYPTARVDAQTLRNLSLADNEEEVHKVVRGVATRARIVVESQPPAAIPWHDLVDHLMGCLGAVDLVESEEAVEARGDRGALDELRPGLNYETVTWAVAGAVAATGSEEAIDAAVNTLLASAIDLFDRLIEGA